MTLEEYEIIAAENEELERKYKTIESELEELERKSAKLKDIRLKQLELLGAGYNNGTYYVTITSFDGRRISRTEAPDHQSWMDLYRKELEAWNQIAHVHASIEFCKE